jgi:hypothetical protein
VQDARWCLIDRPDPARRELYDKQGDRAASSAVPLDRAEEHNVIAGHPQEAERLHRALLDFLARHEAHPALVRWFESGEKGDTAGYAHVPAYLRHFRPYFEQALDSELHG